MEVEPFTDETQKDHSGANQYSSRNFYNLLPSKRKVLLVGTQLEVLVLLYATLYGILGYDALPGSQIFSLLLISVLAHIFGKIVSIIKLPPLIGMLIVGFLFRNLPFISFYLNISFHWATTFRSAAFVVILLKAGLGLDAKKLKALKRIVFQLAFSPCIVETVVLGISSHFLLNMPWEWAIMFGFVVSAVSPAVVVPGLLSLQERSFGIRKGIPTLVIAAASIDDILAIAGFTIMLSVALSTGDNLWITLLKGVLGPLGGLLYGAMLGTLFWLTPSSDISSSSQTFYQVLLLCLGGFSGMFLSKRLGIAGAGPIACLVIAFVASLSWKKNPEHLQEIERVIGVLWVVFQPFLFSLIGAEVSVRNLQSNLGNTVLTLLIGFTFRIITATFATFGGNFNIKEKFFIAISWFPKATVQAAVGTQALDYVLFNKMGKEFEDQAQQVLTGAVLSILMTAPIGAALITLLGPLLLHQDKPEEKDSFEIEGDTAKVDAESEIA